MPLPTDIRPSSRRSLARALALASALPGCSEDPLPSGPGPGAPQAEAAAGACGTGHVDQVALLSRLLDGTAGACDLEWYGRHLDQRGGHNGPWATDIWLARSQDGLAFTPAPSPALPSAGVPELVVAPDGRLLLYTVTGDLEAGLAHARAADGWLATHGIPGYGAVQLHASTDGGATWAAEPAFAIEGLPPGMVVDPEVIPRPGGGWRLYLVHLRPSELVDPAAWEEGAPHRVILAESEDLLRWRVVGEAVTGPFADPTVYCAGDGTCRMWSFGIERATSTDGGRTFTMEGEAVEPGFAPEAVRLPDGRLRLYLNSKAPGAPMHSQVSADGGATFTPERGTRLPVYAEAPSVVRLGDGSWLMAVHRFKPERTPSFAQDGGGAEGGPDGRDPARRIGGSRAQDAGGPGAARGRPGPGGSAAD